MAYYKVLKNNKIIDVLDMLIFLNYQEKHKRMQFCDESVAQAILSSDKKNIWHEETLYDIPVAGYDTVRIEEISKDEYEQEYRRLKVLGGKTAEEILDQFVLVWLDGHKEQFVESLKRLYDARMIDGSKVIELFNDGEITENNKKYILEKTSEEVTAYGE